MPAQLPSRYVTSDSNGNGDLVVAVSRVDDLKGKIPTGELLRVVSIKDPVNDIYVSEAMQQLVQESHVIFRQLQRAAEEGAVNVADILEYSLQYRSVIRSTLSSLESSRHDVMECLESADLIWSLVEAIFFKTHDSSIVVDLITWARVCFPSGLYADEISSSLRAKKIKHLDKEKFWHQITYFVLSGSFNSAITFLEAYVNFTKDSAVRQLKDVLKGLDIDLLNDENTTQDYISYQKEVRQLCASGAFRSNADAERIAMLVAGDEVTMKRAALLLRQWYELVPPYLLFLKPCTTFSQLNDVVKECLKIFGHTVLDGVNAVMSSLFSLEAVRALVNIAKWSNNWWLGAHLADLLQKADEKITFAYDIDFRQRLLLEYGASLFNESGLWRVGCDYLSECGDEGHERLRSLIETIPLDNEKIASKLTAYCSENEFSDLRANIAQTVSFNLLRHKQWVSALSWAFRSNNIDFISMVADQILDQSALDTISSANIIMRQAEIVLLSPSLMRLHEYQKYMELLNRGEKKEAGRTLVELVASSGNSRRFRRKLFLDLIDLLNDDDEVVISKESCYEILKILNNYEHEETQNDDADENRTQLRSLRYLVLRNLSDAIASDGHCQ